MPFSSSLSIAMPKKFSFNKPELEKKDARIAAAIKIKVGTSFCKRFDDYKLVSIILMTFLVIQKIINPAVFCNTFSHNSISFGIPLSNIPARSRTLLVLIDFLCRFMRFIFLLSMSCVLNAYYYYYLYVTKTTMKRLYDLVCYFAFFSSLLLR